LPLNPQAAMERAMSFPPSRASARPARDRRWRRWRWGICGSLALLLAAAAGARLGWFDKRDAHPVDDPWRLAQTALAVDDLEGAKAHLRTFLETWPLHAEGRFTLARVCRRTDDLDGWREHLRAAETLQWPKQEIAREQLLLQVQTGDVWGAEVGL